MASACLTITIINNTIYVRRLVGRELGSNVFDPQTVFPICVFWYYYDSDASGYFNGSSQKW